MLFLDILLHFSDFTYMDLYLQEIAHNNLAHVKIETLGFSTENRPIRLVTINDDDKSKPIILIESGAHSREWIAPAVVLNLIEQLVNNTSPTSRYSYFLVIHTN